MSPAPFSCVENCYVWRFVNAERAEAFGWVFDWRVDVERNVPTAIAGGSTLPNIRVLGGMIQGPDYDDTQGAITYGPIVQLYGDIAPWTGCARSAPPTRSRATFRCTPMRRAGAFRTASPTISRATGPRKSTTSRTLEFGYRPGHGVCFSGKPALALALQWPNEEVACGAQ